MRRTDRYRYPVLMTLLILLQFTVRSRLGGDRVAPDFLLLALMIYTIRAEPGRSAAVGFAVGLLRDALTPEASAPGRWRTRSWDSSRRGRKRCSSPSMYS